MSTVRITDLERRVAALEAAEHRRKRKVTTQSFMRGEDLRRCRLAAQWTCDDLGAALGKSGQTVSQMEGGRLRVSEERAREIVAVFKRVAHASPDVALEVPMMIEHSIPLRSRS